MTVVRRSYPSLPSLTGNTIYVLQTWAINIGGPVNIPSCTAIVSKVDGWTTVYSNNQITNDWMFYVGRGKGGVIIDNINFEWTHYGTNGTHSGNFNCIYLYWDDASNGATSNISVNNSKVARCENWIKVWLTKINYINLTNITLVNNGYWIYLFGAGRVSMNNIIWQSQTEIYSDQANYISINNTAFSSLFDTYIYFNNWTWLVVNNSIASVYTTTNGCIVNNLIWFVWSSNSSSIKCKLYGTLKIPSIWTCPDTAVQQQWSWSSLWWNAGSSPQNLGCYNWEYVVNPIANGVNPLYPWNTTTLTYLYYWCDWQPLNCYSIQSFGAALDALSSNYKYSFGSQVPEQQSPVRWNNTTLSLWNTDWCSNCFIWSNLKKLSSISSTLPAIVTWSTSLTVTGNGGWFVSKYNVLWPHITSQQYNKTIWVNTTVYWTNGDGPKAVIFQVTGSNYYAMHFMGETERTSSGPSFTLNGTTVDECSSKTWTGFTNYSTTNLDPSPFGHQFPWEGSISRSTSPSLTYTAWGSAWSYNFTWQLKSSNGIISTHTATITVNNVLPSGNNFTWHSNVQSSAKTVNWKTLSNASEWNCGNGSLTASVYSQWSQWSCSINGVNITYTPNPTRPGWTDQCTIRIKDNENSTKNVIVYRWGIDPTNWPNGTVSINNWAVATNSTSLTLYLTWNSLATQVRFSCTNTNSNWTTWTGVAATKSFTLSSSYWCNTTDWTKTIYAQFKSSTVTWATASDTIIYDTVKPTVSVSLNSAWGTVTISDTTSWLSWNQLLYYLY